MKGKFYQIKYILSNEKLIVHAEKRDKVIKEWNEVKDLSAEELHKYLKLGKGKYKSKEDKDKEKEISVVEVRLIDWVNSVMVNRVFDKVEGNMGDKNEIKEEVGIEIKEEGSVISS